MNRIESQQLPKVKLPRAMDYAGCKAIFEELIAEKGLMALNKSWLDHNGYTALHKRLATLKISMEYLARDLNAFESWVENRYKFSDSAMTPDEVVKAWKEIIVTHGIDKLHQKQWMKENGHSKLVHRTINLHLSKEHIAECCGLLPEYKESIKRSRNRWSEDQRWSVERIKEVASEIAEKHDGIPSQPFLESNGYSGFLGAIWRNNISFDSIVSDFGGTRYRLISRAGLQFRSYPEVCLSNFLHARNISHTTGKKYPIPFPGSSEHGYYDVHFIGQKKSYDGSTINVEIWGDDDLHYSERYELRKAQKIDFNKDDHLFLGINYQDCYTDASLTKILDKYIYTEQVTKNDFKSMIDTTTWSIADYVIQKSEKIKQDLNVLHLPPNDWFRREHTYAHRCVLSWEPASWNPFLYDIEKIGGFKKLRQLLSEKDFSHHVRADLTKALMQS